ncbi:MAG: cation:proton antiporter subunit C [Clostridiaceae bacterium]|jgi:multicomponent Na+:H+ antiporter subunit C|nr:cation:proton antiporter subunit C [Clostridiaceae bacterium]
MNINVLLDWISGEHISLVLFFVGLYGLVARRNMLKSILSIGIMQAAAILYFLSADLAENSVPPVGESVAGQAMADPLPQAMMITDIVIGIGVTAIALTLMIHLYHRYGTANWQKARDKRRE